MSDAAELYKGVRLADAVRAAEDNRDFVKLRELELNLSQEPRLVSPSQLSASLLLRGQEDLSSCFAAHLIGVRPTLEIEGIDEVKLTSQPVTQLVPSWTCPDLLGAMWLQLYQATIAKRLRARCKSCGAAFDARHARQLHCSELCRKAHEMRRYRQRHGTK